jgi:hypothetical protein
MHAENGRMPASVIDVVPKIIDESFIKEATK